MRGFLKHNGTEWEVIERIKIDAINVKTRYYTLHPNPALFAFIQFKNLLPVEFETATYCKAHNCLIENSSPCTLDCDEIEVVIKLMDVSQCSHSYSKSMDQEFPRKCIWCDEVEEQAPIELTYGYIEDYSQSNTDDELFQAFRAGVRYMSQNVRPEDAVDFKTFLEQLKQKRNEDKNILGNRG